MQFISLNFWKMYFIDVLCMFSFEKHSQKYEFQFHLVYKEEIGYCYESIFGKLYQI